MGNIIRLDKNLANQIAAGEVVERPLSVVKELVENAIDAHASKIKIELEAGGKSCICIRDNGSGIDKEDLEICLEKYTTSKIKSIQDLYQIMTFWFRWEALSAISSVSRMSIISKPKNASTGYELTSENGEQNIKPAMAEDGTQITVKDLFFNTPARLNYLKTDKTEYLKIVDYLHQASLSYPHIGFECWHEGKNVFTYAPNEDLKTRIYHIYGEETSKNLVFIHFEMTGIVVSGYISDPKVSFQNKTRQNIFVNGRPIQSPLINKAAHDAYNRFIPHGCYPAFVLKLEVDPTQVDVNVHPRKQEVRFASEQTIFRSVYHAILNKLEAHSLIQHDSPKIENNDTSYTPSATNFFPWENWSWKIAEYYTGSGTKMKDYSPYKNTQPNPNQFTIKESIDVTKAFLSHHHEESPESGDIHYTKLWKIIGQAFFSYILVEKDKKLFMYDQHALAERILYEKLVKKGMNDDVQKLLVPETLKLSVSEIETLQSHFDVIRDLWFEIEFLSHGIISIGSIPQFIKKESIWNIFWGILQDIQEGNLESKTLEEVKNKIYAYTACRSAIKFGNKLNLFEMNALLNDAVEWYSSTCPHGRPVIFEITLDELKDKYER